jgi:hypothetical protein
MWLNRSSIAAGLGAMGLYVLQWLLGTLVFLNPWCPP